MCTLDNSDGTLFDDGFLPADLDTTALPLPPYTPEVYLGSIDNFASETNVYEYTYALNPTNPWTVAPCSPEPTEPTRSLSLTPPSVRLCRPTSVCAASEAHA